MTLKEMLNQTLSEVGFGTYNEFFSSPRPDAAQMVALAKREINDLSKHNWQALTREHEVTMTSATEYDLPSDFRQFVPDTAFTDTRRAKFPATADEWGWYAARNINTGLSLRVRIIDGSLQIQNPDAGQVVRFEYISNSPVLDGDSTTRKRQFTADSDTILLDEDLFMLGLVWRFRRAKGMDWQAHLGEYNGMRRRVQGTDKGSRTLSMASGGEALPEPQANLHL